MAMQCAYHPDREPIGACVACGRLICVECKALLGGKIYCTPCADKIFVHKQPETVSPLKEAVPPPPPIATTPPQYAQQTAAAPQQTEPVTETRATTSESGEGTASVLPEELKGWNWGAFFLSWIWGIGNSVWIALIALIPVPLVGLVMMFVLGAKGNEWAWQHKKWDSIDHFKRVQRIWKRWGVGLFIAGVVIGVIYLIVIGFLLLSGMGTFRMP